MMDEKQNQVFYTYQAAPEHSYPGHPESPERFRVFEDWLRDSSFPGMQQLNYQPATLGDLVLGHTQRMLEALQEECRFGAHEIEHAPTYVTPASFQAALGAAGATLAVSRKVINEDGGMGFAIVRPPGHHAAREQAMGFCLFNNLAIAAADAVISGVGKVAIFDFDAHHGNGIEDIFWNTEQVGYCSIHEQGLYPGTGEIEAAPHAPGRLINLPVPAFSGTKVFEQLFDQVVTPWLEAFQPDMLFVAAGYDAHFSDPLTSLTMNTQGFFNITQKLVDLADRLTGGKMVLALEGGYDALALSDNLQASLAALCGEDEYSDHYGKGPDQSRTIAPLIETVRKNHNL
ncbi:histone deacetylase [Chloroflexota bacterium]|nr:histone deacetylase [Chloroflexota bacterium]